jgi:surface antigen
MHKMRKTKMAAVCVALLALVAACESRQTTGTLVGAGGGAIAAKALGGGWFGMAVGALVGGLLGSEVGKRLDREDVERADTTNQKAMETNNPGQSSTWSNPNTGNSGSVTPTTNAYVAQGGATCRDFQQTVSAAGTTESGTGRACKQPDGSWKVNN